MKYLKTYNQIINEISNNEVNLKKLSISQIKYEDVTAVYGIFKDIFHIPKKEILYNTDWLDQQSKDGYLIKFRVF